MYDNEFSFTRDNVLEPEYDASNWWFFNNRIRNAHAWFSFDGLYGGRWYVSTTSAGSTTSRAANAPSTANASSGRNKVPRCAPTCTTAGASSSSGPTAAMRRVGSTSSITAGICGRASSRTAVSATSVHWDNPIAFCRPEDYPDGLCEGSKPFFNGFLWDNDNYAFNHDLSNHPDFPAGLRAQGYRVSGISVSPSQPLFSDAAHGDFSLVEGGPGRGAGCLIDEDERGLLECLDPLPPVSGPDIGAPEGGAAGPAVDFLFYDGGLYPEPPRIVRADLPRPEWTATAGVPPADRLLDPDPAHGVRSAGRFRLWRCRPVHKLRRLPVQRPHAHLPGQRRAADRPAATCLVPDAMVGPTGLLATTWGSVSDVFGPLR